MTPDCAICQWISQYRAKDLGPLERKALVDREVEHLSKFHLRETER